VRIDADEADARTLYRTLSGAVVPRPIGWISTRGRDGADNLAPYSFFNVACIDPPTLSFSAGRGADDGPKDSARNARETGEFVVNVVTADLAAAMNATSTTAAVDEFEVAGVTKVESARVAPPRVAAAKVTFECRLVDRVPLGTNALLLGEVVLAHVADEVVTDGRLDTGKLDAVGRLAGSMYAHTRDRFSMERPE